MKAKDMSQIAVRSDTEYEEAEVEKHAFVSQYSSEEEIRTAIEELDRLVSAGSVSLETLLRLVLLHFELKQYDKAYPVLKNAVSHHPESGQLWFLLGNCLFMLHYYEAALVAYDNSQKNGHAPVQLYHEQAQCLLYLNRFDDALSLANQSLAITPDSIGAWQVKGTICEMKGDLDRAQKSYERILELSPGENAVLYRLSDMGRLSDENFQLCDPTHPVHKNTPKTWLNLAYLHFARAFECARKKKFDAAFQCYVAANSAIRSEYKFDREALSKRTDEHIKFFSKALFDQNTMDSETSLKPIFILGMPRSGTTLIEQIISSHPSIEAGGELNYIFRIEQSLSAVAAQGSTAYPESISSLTADSLAEYRQQYIACMRGSVAGASEFATDKMPINFLNLGLIGLIFPHAKIIHAKRDPLDTCLSCFFKHFTDYDNMSFSYDLEDTGYYYNEYLKLMDHWREVIPNPVIEVQYEELIDNQEDVTRDLLAFLEQPWDARCMEFHENRRGVITASLHQVRKPIYKSSAGRWKRYEKHIARLRRILDQ